MRIKTLTFDVDATVEGSALEQQVIALGKRCAVDVTGDPEYADRVTCIEYAFNAIETALKLGIEANDHRNELLMEVPSHNRRLKAITDFVTRATRTH